MTWEQRFHPLLEEWIILAAHRNERPWVGRTVGDSAPPPPEYAPDCPLCPGNVRVSGVRNPDYTGVFVFDNDHPCAGSRAPRDLETPPDVYRNRPAAGAARVICYSPLHNRTLAELEVAEIVELLRVWQEQYRALGSSPDVDHVLIFENKGEAVGVSNPHPHCQIYATNFVFRTIATEARVSKRHWEENRRVLFEEIIAAELADGRRIVAQRDSAIAFVPYFARWAYETFVAPKATYLSLADVPPAELEDLADILREVTIRFDNLWRMPFPYVMVLHQAPTDGTDHEGFHFHIEFHPPLRKPHLLKHLAGPEIGGGNFLSDTCPEDKAAELRDVPAVHYRKTDDSRPTEV